MIIVITYAVALFALGAEGPEADAAPPRELRQQQPLQAVV